MKNEMVYEVFKLTGPMNIDADWSKPQWKNIWPVDITNYLGAVPGFKPGAQAKMMYDEDNIYVIFHVIDRYVRCITDKINGPVWEDSCVEFFFAPDKNFPERYFNLETNCGGTPLMHFNIIPRKENIDLAEEDIKKIKIAHTMPAIVDPEIKNPVAWTLEYKIPLSMLSGYAPVDKPGPGVTWRANFYKIAENNSNPHYITWSPIIVEVPDFHLPKFFGILKFR